MNDKPPPLLRRWAFRAIAALVVSCLLPTAGGCGHLVNLKSPERLDRGYTLILPGIEGANPIHPGQAVGLAAAGVPTAIEVHDWTSGGPALMLLHLRCSDRNRRQAELLAQKIVAYQDRYPGRPVHLIGHSGGSGIAVMAIEALPPERNVTSAVLLASALSPTYDLTTALSKTEQGIFSYRSMVDVPLLIVGTTVAGTVDGRHMPAAGAVGFRRPRHLDPAGHELYDRKLFEQPYHPRMLAGGNYGGHFGCTMPLFAYSELSELFDM